MIQETSLRAFDQLRTSEQLGADERVVLDVLKSCPEGLTDREIAQRLGGPSFGWVPSRVSARRNGIISHCMIQRTDWTIGPRVRRKCRLSGHQAIAWGIVEGDGSQLRFGF